MWARSFIASETSDGIGEAARSRPHGDSTHAGIYAPGHSRRNVTPVSRA